MINATSLHNWAVVLAIVLLGGIALHVLGKRVAPVGKVVQAAFGA